MVYFKLNCLTVYNLWSTCLQLGQGYHTCPVSMRSELCKLHTKADLDLPLLDLRQVCNYVRSATMRRRTAVEDGGGGGGWWHFPTFVPESKNDSIPEPYIYVRCVCGEGGGRGEVVDPTFLPKSKSD